MRYGPGRAHQPRQLLTATLRSLTLALWRFARRFETRVLLLLAGVAGALWSFLEIAGEVAEDETSQVDSRIILLLREPGDLNDPIGSRSFEEAVRDVTALGGTTLVVMVTLVAVLAFAAHRKFAHAAVMGAAVLAAWASTDLTKLLYGRPRPDLVPHASYVYSHSFPSGHSSLAAAAYLTLAVLASSLTQRRSAKALAYLMAVAVLMAVGFSRVYLGVHWPSDVLAGWCLGAAWAMAAWIALRGLEARVSKP